MKGLAALLVPCSAKPHPGAFPQPALSPSARVIVLALSASTAVTLQQGWPSAHLSPALSGCGPPYPDPLTGLCPSSILGMEWWG